MAIRRSARFWRAATQWGLVATLGAIGVSACVRVPHLHDVREAPSRAAAGSDLKVHLYSGELVVLTEWRETDSVLNGAGDLYSIQRIRQRSGRFTIPFDSIALLETATREPTAAAVGVSMLAVWSTLMGAITVQCISDPKSCFGSCPTFYVHDGTREVLQAEGFSGSIARALEARDVDALYRARPTGSQFIVRMTNEALETHAVRTVRVHAVPRPPGGRVFAAGDGRYYAGYDLLPASRCTGQTGDCLDAVAALDNLERRSFADSTNLARREMLELEFPRAAGQLGLVIAARHSFVSTFLFYQTMAHLGSQAGEFMAALERGGPEEAGNVMGMARALGGIEAEVLDERGEWQPIGSYDEAGPIATDLVVIPFHRRDHTRSVRVRLWLAQGAWRVNHVGLVQLGDPIAPIVLEPQLVERQSVEDEQALRLLRNPNRYLITYPGDEYRLAFTLPRQGENLELFLESQGYYYEWMRAEWIAEENLAMASLAMLRPEEALRRLAPLFKRVEPEMERLFWESRYGR